MPRARRRKATELSSQIRFAFVEEPKVRRTDRVDVRCRGCRRPFSVPRWYAEKGLELHFCGNHCREAWESGEDESTAVQLAGRPAFRGGNWKIEAARTRRRDGFRCRICGRSEEALGRRLDVHHLVPARMFEAASDANRSDNLISVCPSCHKAVEEKGRSQFPIFDEFKHRGKRSGSG